MIEMLFLLKWYDVKWVILSSDIHAHIYGLIKRRKTCIKFNENNSNSKYLEKDHLKIIRRPITLNCSGYETN